LGGIFWDFFFEFFRISVEYFCIFLIFLCYCNFSYNYSREPGVLCVVRVGLWGWWGPGGVCASLRSNIPRSALCVNWTPTILIDCLIEFWWGSTCRQFCRQFQKCDRKPQSYAMLDIGLSKSFQLLDFLTASEPTAAVPSLQS
jgi:hypothetical protein